MDEKSMILEQERQKKAKKRKKHKKMKIACGIATVLLLAGCTFYVVKGRELMAASQTNTVEIVAQEGQTILYARIASIYGNEITYVETQMPQMNTLVGDAQDDASEGRGSRPDMEGVKGFGGEMPESFEGGMLGDGNMPGGFGSGRGQRSNMSGNTSGSGERTEDSSREMSRGERAEGFGGGMPSGEMPEGFGGENDRQETTEQITTYIPVGTEVITKLGMTTTFSRLATGDYVALVMEEEDGEQIIMAVYIVG